MQRVIRPAILLSCAAIIMLTVLSFYSARDGQASAAESGAPAFADKRSSGVFFLPPTAKSVDWVVINGGTIPQKFQVTVFKCNLGAPKTPVPPGPVTQTIAPGVSFHNANSVGPGSRSRSASITKS